LGGLLSKTVLLRCFDGILLEQGTGQTQIWMTITWDLLRFSVNIQTRGFHMQEATHPSKKNPRGCFQIKKVTGKGPTTKIMED